MNGCLKGFYHAALVVLSVLAGLVLATGVAEGLKKLSRSHLAVQEPSTAVKWRDDLIREAYFNPEHGTPVDTGKPAKLHTVYVQVHPQGRSYEFGLRSDGVVVWREVK